MLALQGPSGSGKTTLLLLAAAALRRRRGARPLRGPRPRGAVRARGARSTGSREVGLVSQNTHLMARVSAVENAATKLLLGGVALGEAREQALHWLSASGWASAPSAHRRSSPAASASASRSRARSPASRG